ncbi:hypothetical protein CN380_02680 [Bacillus sp. AFS017274]|nr:hypothetical protein CN380_02680 [Bacillus sp. AFS017274]
MAAPYLYFLLNLLVCKAIQQSVNSLIYHKYLPLVPAPSASLNSFFLDYLSYLYHWPLLLFLSKTVQFAPQLKRVFYYQGGYI